MEISSNLVAFSKNTNFKRAKLSKPTGQKISKVRKQQNIFFNSANLILMSIGKSGIIKFEFQTT